MNYTLSRLEKILNENGSLKEIFITIKLRINANKTWEYGYWLIPVELDLVISNEQNLIPIIDAVAVKAEQIYNEYINQPTGPTGPTGPIGIPIGPTGPQGVVGPQGATGAQGAKGATGAQGAKGSTGAQGAKGSTGAQGAKGSTGAQGAKGSTGAQGAKGSTGAQGAKGSTGAQGVTGAKGSTGAQGIKGDLFYPNYYYAEALGESFTTSSYPNYINKLIFNVTPVAGIYELEWYYEGVNSVGSYDNNTKISYTSPSSSNTLFENRYQVNMNYSQNGWSPFHGFIKMALNGENMNFYFDFCRNNSGTAYVKNVKFLLKRIG